MGDLRGDFVGAFLAVAGSSGTFGAEFAEDFAAGFRRVGWTGAASAAAGGSVAGALRFEAAGAFPAGAATAGPPAVNCCSAISQKCSD